MDHFKKKYDVIFNFYFAKSINKLFAKKRNNPQCILLKDYAYYDLEIQFFKRFYKSHQVPQRIEMLADYFQREREFPFFTPNINLTTGKKFIQKRKKRYRKLRIKLQQLRSQQSVQYDSQFLNTIKTQQLQQQQFSGRYGQLNVSYESQLFDIYDGSSSKNDIQPQELVVNYKNFIIPILQYGQEQRQSHQIEERQLNHLICDFNDVDVDRILSQYNNLQDNKKLKLNLKGINKYPKQKQQQYSFQKNLRQKLQKNKLNYYQEKQGKKQTMIQTVEGKVYFVKGLSKKMQNEKSNQNYDQYLLNRKSDRINQKMIQNQNNIYDEKFKDLKKLNFKSSDSKKIQQLIENGSRQRSTRISPQIVTDRVSSGFQSDRLSTDIERELKYLRLIQKVKQKNKKQQIIERINTARSPEQRYARYQFNNIKKIEKIKQKAVELINSNENRKVSLLQSKNSYKNSQFYNINPHLRYN